MTDYIARNLKQTLTLWAKSSIDVFGKVTWATPITVKCRFEERSELFIDASGNEVRARARVYIDTDAALGDYILLGTSTVADPTTLTNTAFEVRDFKKIPNLAGTRFERRVFI